MAKLPNASVVILPLFELILIFIYFFVLIPQFDAIAYLPIPSSDPKKISTCDNFVTQAEAQNYFEANKAINKSLLTLDRDHDGKVCEQLP